MGFVFIGKLNYWHNWTQRRGPNKEDDPKKSKKKIEFIPYVYELQLVIGS